MLFRSGCVVRDNYSFGFVNENITVTSEHASKFNVIENNPCYLDYTGPEIFVNPALGDYRIKSDSVIDIYVPFELMGRY